MHFNKHLGVHFNDYLVTKFVVQNDWLLVFVKYFYYHMLLEDVQTYDHYRRISHKFPILPYVSLCFYRVLPSPPHCSFQSVKNINK